MRVAPVVIHAQRRIPALSGLFSDALSVSTIDVVAGGTTTINFAAAHGLPFGSQITVSITDAETPNPISAATVDSSGNAVLTTQYPHDLTTTPALARAKPWNEFAKLAGFGSAILDGTKQLIDVPDRNTLIVGPSAPIGAITLDGDEVLLEKLEREIVGGHDASVATGTTLTFTTPSAITRNYRRGNAKPYLSSHGGFVR